MKHGCFNYDFDANNYYILNTVNGNIDNYVIRLFTHYIRLKMFNNYIAPKRLPTISRKKSLATISKHLAEDREVSIIKLKQYMTSIRN